MDFIGRQLGATTSADEHATVMILVAEARRLDIECSVRAAVDEEEATAVRRDLNVKWRDVRDEMCALLRAGHNPRMIRALLAAKYPFLGLKSQDEIERTRRVNEVHIAQLNQQVAAAIVEEAAVAADFDSNFDINTAVVAGFTVVEEEDPMHALDGGDSNVIPVGAPAVVAESWEEEGVAAAADDVVPAPEERDVDDNVVAGSGSYRSLSSSLDDDLEEDEAFDEDLLEYSREALRVSTGGSDADVDADVNAASHMPPVYFPHCPAGGGDDYLHASRASSFDSIGDGGSSSGSLCGSPDDSARKRQCVPAVCGEPTEIIVS